MRHVKLARDRRKRKSRIKAVIFFMAILLITLGTILSLKENVESPGLVIETALNNDDTEYQSLHPQNVNSPNNQETSSSNHTEKSAVENSDVLKEGNGTIPKAEHEGEATSYYDDLEAQDDEADEVKPSFDELDDLPPEAQSALNDILDAADQAIRISDQFSHTVVRGDTLKDVLELSGLDESTANQLLAGYPEFKNLKAGQQFYWILDNQDRLEYLNWLVSEKEERIYERQDDGKFKRQILTKKSQWKKETLKGQVNGSFAGSLRALGLDSRQINQLITALQWQVSLQKLKKGTKFAVLVSREYLGDKLTGQGNVEAIHILANGKSYYAIQAANGRYYNRQGETLGKGFARYPLQRQARISSPFNPNRRHPITGRVRPHKGIDFSLPVGSPVIAPADAMVEKVAYQARGAGRYIVLRHGREYQTVYMHLSKPLVRAGQTVKKGERIALSGNTGMSTGPHLHYEFHINGRAVNPATVKLPGGNSSMGTAERRQFLVRAVAAERALRLQ
ncbi:murein DD-endopeptidase MepM [Rodentibacter caecimuris]|uniref:Peptidase M23 n=1 Tax=Rodentibacter caecimuris TaxID=1796644 RepID=A0ABX3KVS1_9PAST|nr:peptidase M23 [Rodentibacter heylii]